MSRKGLTAQRLHAVFSSVLNENIDSKWSVSDEEYSSARSMEGGKEMVEFIAPQSLAYFYAK